MKGAFVVNEDTPLMETLRRIDQGTLQLAIVERDGKIVGTVTDGDVRRALLGGTGLDASVSLVMNRTPITAPVGISRSGCAQFDAQAFDPPASAGRCGGGGWSRSA
ncbi:CBS domain-containing protein [Bradyrhizobium betae]